MNKLLKVKFILGIIFLLLTIFIGKVSASGPITKTLKYGMKDIEVKYLQQTLNEKGYAIAKTGAGAKGLETTYFGNATKTAVKTYQKAKGLVADGIFGAKSRATLGSTFPPVITNYPPVGCSQNAIFNTLTGARCDGTTAINYPAGCYGTSGFSTLTGAKCDSTTNTRSVVGGGGSSGGGGGGGGNPIVPNSAPVISITSPVNNSTFTTGSNLTIQAGATDVDNNLSKVEFYQGTIKLGEDTTSPFSYLWNNVPTGVYSLTAKAIDGANATTTSAIVKVTASPQAPPPNKAPTVSITSPTNNSSYTAPASITINATASDTDGTISKVEFYKGTVLLNSDTTSPYSYAWSNVSAGSYILTAKAYDNSGSSTVSSNIIVTFLTNNTVPTISITNPSSNGTSIPINSTVNFSGTVSDSDSSSLTVSWYLDRIGDGFQSALLKETTQSSGDTTGSIKMSGTKTSTTGQTISLEVINATYNLTLKVSDGVNVVETLRSFVLSPEENTPVNVPLYDIYEKSFNHSGSYANPYVSVKADALLLSPSGKQLTVPLFWDGGTVWKMRFSPTELGSWSYTTESNDPSLNGKSERLTVVNSGERGFIVRDPSNSYAFKYSNGEQVFPMGDTVWNAMSNAGGLLNNSTYKSYIDIRASQKFNFVRSYVVAMYANATVSAHYNEGGRAFEPWNPDNINPEYFKEADRRIAYATSKGITMHLLVGGDGTTMTNFFGWGNGKMERWIRYLTGRYSAYNINWEGRAEFEEQGNTTPGYVTLINTIGNWIEKYDSSGHLQSTHTLNSNNEVGSQDWLDWLMNQGQNWAGILQDRSYNKPVMNEEFYYENSGAGATHPHHVDADTMRKGAWQVMMAGASGLAFGNTGTYNSSSKPFVGIEYVSTPGANYMTYLYNFFETTGTQNLLPNSSLCTTAVCLALPGQEYVAFHESGPGFAIELPRGTYTARFYNPKTGVFNSSFQQEGCGLKGFTKPDANDWVLHLKLTSLGNSCSEDNPLDTETIVLQDSLLGNTSGTKVGGTITTDGYKPGIGTGHILYNIPEQISNGYVEFEMKGFSPSLIVDPLEPLGDADTGFIGMYDGRGINEPIKYINNFKYNYFRWNFHYRQDRSQFKSVVSCAAPTAERLNSSYAVFSGGGDLRDWYSEPTGTNYSFDANNWYTVKIEWKNKNFKVTINGTTVWSVSDGPYDYAPKDFKIWLGSAPGYDDKYVNSVRNIIYRNFKVVKYTSSLASLDTSIPLTANVSNTDEMLTDFSNKIIELSSNVYNFLAFYIVSLFTSIF